MANSLALIIPKLLAQGLLALRQQSIMPRLVNRDYDQMAAQKGAVINVPIPSAITASAVTPGLSRPANQDSAPTTVPITLDQWYEAPFYLTDKDMLETMNGTIPMQASEAIKAIANNVDGYILSKGAAVYSAAGTAGVTPFATDASAYGTARRLLNTTLAPIDDRRVVLDALAEGNAAVLPQFVNFYQRGDVQGIQSATIGRKLGADWYLDQNVKTQATTPMTAGAATVNGVNAAGSTTLSIAKATNASPLIVGDVFTMAGFAQQYVVTAAVTLAVGNTSVSISPKLAAATAGGEAVTLVAAHTMNLAFHRDAFAFASRPLQGTVEDGLGSLVSAAVDPISGLTLRLEVSRQYKQTTFSFDVLYGAALIRPELACRILG